MKTDASGAAVAPATGPGTEQERSRSLVFLDFETTGLSVSRARIVELAMVRLDPDGSREEWSTLVNPEGPIPSESRAVHGIHDADVADQKTFRELAPDVERFIGRHDLGGHNLVGYDLPLLQAELQRAGRPPLAMEGRRCVDTLIIFRKLEPHSLSKALSFYCPDLGDRSGASVIASRHRALGDATAGLEVFLAQTQRYPTELGASVASAAAFCTSRPAGSEDLPKGLLRSNGDVVLDFGKHRGRSLPDIARTDPGYLRWFLRADRDRRLEPRLAKAFTDALAAR